MVYLHSCGSSIEILNLSGGTVQSVDMQYNFIVLTIKLAATKMDVKTMEEFIYAKEKEVVKDILQSKFMITYSEEFEEFWKEYTATWDDDTIFIVALKEIAFAAWEARPMWIER